MMIHQVLQSIQLSIVVVHIPKEAVTAFAFSLPNAGKEEYDVVIRAAKEITNDLLNLFFCCMLFHINIRVIGVAEN